MFYVIAVTLIIGIALYFQKNKNKKTGMQAIPQDVLPQSFVVFDLETTGLKADVHEIIEFGAIRFEKGRQTQDTFQGLIKPTKSIPKKITEITNITQQMVDADGEPIAKTLEEFRKFVGDLRLVSFNAEFDMAFLQAAAVGTGQPQFSNPVSCALKMSRRAWPNRKSFKLENLAADAGIADGTGHRALEDARRALVIYCAAAAQLNAIS